MQINKGLLLIEKEFEKHLLLEEQSESKFSQDGKTFFKKNEVEI